MFLFQEALDPREAIPPTITSDHHRSLCLLNPSTSSTEYQIPLPTGNSNVQYQCNDDDDDDDNDDDDDDDDEKKEQRKKRGGACLLRYCVCYPVSLSLNIVFHDDDDDGDYDDYDDDYDDDDDESAT